MPGNNTRTNITTEQSALVYDLLSEGPIEGLVDGVASIRLDGNPVANSTNKQKLSPQRSVDSAYTSSTGVSMCERCGQKPALLMIMKF